MNKIFSLLLFVFSFISQGQVGCLKIQFKTTELNVINTYKLVKDNEVVRLDSVFLKSKKDYLIIDSLSCGIYNLYLYQNWKNMQAIESILIDSACTYVVFRDNYFDYSYDGGVDEMREELPEASEFHVSKPYIPAVFSFEFGATILGGIEEQVNTLGSGGQLAFSYRSPINTKCAWGYVTSVNWSGNGGAKDTLNRKQKVQIINWSNELFLSFGNYSQSPPKRNFIELGLKYNLPLYARLKVYDDDFNIIVKNIHRYTDSRVFLRYANRFSFISFEYTPFDFIDSGRFTVPKYSLTLGFAFRDID